MANKISNITKQCLDVSAAGKELRASEGIRKKHQEEASGSIENWASDATDYSQARECVSVRSDTDVIFIRGIT